LQNSLLDSSLLWTYSLWLEARHKWDFKRQGWCLIGLKGVGAILLLVFHDWLFFTNDIRAMPFLGVFTPKLFEVQASEYKIRSFASSFFLVL
jgi:hypothetical protein